MATVPDLITIVDHDSCMPITSDLVEYGQRVAVLLLPPPEQLTLPQVVDVLGPQAFGYDVVYNKDHEFVQTASYIPPP